MISRAGRGATMVLDGDGPRHFATKERDQKRSARECGARPVASASRLRLGCISCRDLPRSALWRAASLRGAERSKGCWTLTAGAADDMTSGGGGVAADPRPYEEREVRSARRRRPDRTTPLTRGHNDQHSIVSPG